MRCPCHPLCLLCKGVAFHRGGVGRGCGVGRGLGVRVTLGVGVGVSLGVGVTVGVGVGPDCAQYLPPVLL
jgi:hypothetical protein